MSPRRGFSSTGTCASLAQGYLTMAEKRTESARTESIDSVEVDVLENLETPEMIMLSALCGGDLAEDIEMTSAGLRGLAGSAHPVLVSYLRGAILLPGSLQTAIGERSGQYAINSRQAWKSLPIIQRESLAFGNLDLSQSSIR